MASDDIEEASGGDTISALPPAPPTRTLQGIEGVLSSRGFNADSGPGGPSGAGGDGGATAAAAASFADYLAAQRALKKSMGRRKTVPAAAGSNVPETDGKGSSLALNPALLVAASRLKSKATEAKARVAERTASEIRVVQALGALAHGGRGSVTDGAGDWKNAFEELENIDEDGHFAGHGDHGDVSLPFYAPPVQRQRWGEDQVLPHVNWGDLFFDLFYVGMAYNLGVMLTSAADDLTFLRGFIYFVGCFGTLWNSWESTTFYESRYTTVDYCHRLFEVLRFLFVATAIAHIGSIDLLSDPRSPEAMIFCIATLGEGLMHLGLNVELLLRAHGDRDAITNHTKRMIKCMLPTLLLYAAAVVVSVWLHERSEDDEEQLSPHRRYLAEVDHEEGDYLNNYEKSHWRIEDLPFTLMAAAFIQNIVLTLVLEVRATSGKKGDVRTCLVPSNIDYMIHRYGEWCLLMIGEGILSLLIVETAEITDYYIITTFGTLTMIFIQILKFESEPSHAEGHALWRSLVNGKCYSYLVQILSMSLIAFGVMYKVFLNSVVKSYKDNEGEHRFLAGGSMIKDETSAALFCGGLTALLLSLELMSLTHSGVGKSDLLGHILKQSESANREVDWTIVIILILKIGIFSFAVTLQYLTTEPDVLTMCGCAIVAAMASTRIFIHYYLYRRAVLTKLTGNIQSTAKKAAENLSSAAAPILNLSERKVRRKSSVGESDTNLNSDVERGI